MCLIEIHSMSKKYNGLGTAFFKASSNSIVCFRNLPKVP